MNAIAGPDHRDSTAVTVPVPDYTAGLEEGVKGMRIGLSPDFFKIQYFNHETGQMEEEPISDEIKQAVEQAADRLSEMGARIVENVPMPHTKYGIPTYFVISRVEVASNLHRFDGVKYGYRTEKAVADLQEMYRRTRAEGFGPQPKLRILMGMYVSAAQYSEQYYQQALKVRSQIRGDFDLIYDPDGDYRVDALLTPATPTPAFKFGEIYGDTVLMQYADQFTVTANQAGIPGLTMMGGLSSERLPQGIQLLGRDYDEATLLRIGRAFEVATEDAAWRKEKPAVLAGLD
jgi:aspartyl-tRNA(Asn)/glutamyl-tRNA(Gln) amidotransferase subunit A